MQGLVEAAQRVIDTWQSGDLAGAVRALQQVMPEQADEALRERAAVQYASDDIEIDDVAYAAKSNDGAWVSAWVWVPKD